MKRYGLDHHILYCRQQCSKHTKTNTGVGGGWCWTYITSTRTHVRCRAE